MKESITFIGLDVHKNTIDVAIADEGRNAEIRYYGTIGGGLDDIDRLVKKLTISGKELHFVYEAGPCGYDIFRSLTEKGFDCAVCSPAHIPKSPASRIKTDRVGRLTQQIESLVSTWRMAPVVSALHALRGVSLIVTSTMMAELGDLARFKNPKQLMAFLGLVPSEHSSGDKEVRGSITKTGNGHARRVLVEAGHDHPSFAQAPGGDKPGSEGDCLEMPSKAMCPLPEIDDERQK